MGANGQRHVVHGAKGSFQKNKKQQRGVVDSSVLAKWGVSLRLLNKPYFFVEPQNSHS
jgi:hypothetical protein